MSEQAASSRDDFRTVLGDQQRRVVAAVATEKTIDPTPIVRDDEVISCEEYVTLVYELHHVQLPELEAGGVIEFDRREETVSRGTHFDEARPLCKPGDDQGDTPG
ncbi:hypothetical protein [Halosimplex salinum]|uniref:hypothetical protein n=1 Tax=Halosimplex salinum TaxID=1710538 RepID=UPI0019D313CF|nr:hypothetical protein [Halosimplex salinum]